MSKIIALKAQNIKRLSAVEIEPAADEPLVVVGGENAQGKTSVLDSIMYALAGSKSIPEDVVRHGEKKGVIELEINDYVITRILGKGAKLEVKSKDGGKFGSPQGLLDNMVGKLSFDPLKFQRLGETTQGRREQAAMLRELIGLDFSEADRQRKSIFDERTEANKDLKKVQALLDRKPYHKDAPKELLTADELSEELEKALEHNYKAEQLKDKLTHYDAVFEDIDKQIAELEKKKEALTVEKITIKGLLIKFKEIDITELKSKIANVESINKQIRENQEREELLRKESELQSQSEKLTDKLEEIDETKKKALAEAKMPIDNLSFDENGVSYNGVPFENCSSAEQLKLSIAMALAMNPTLKVMLIRDGSLLDNESMKTLREMAKDSDAQVWIERVGKGEECTVIIEDGAIV